MAPVAQPPRQGPARSPRAHRMLRHGQPTPPRRSSRIDHPRTLEQDPRSARPGRRFTGLLASPERGPEHRHALRPHARTPHLAHRPHLPPDAGRPLPRPSAVPVAPPTPRSPSPCRSPRSGSRVTPAGPPCWSAIPNQGSAEGQRPVTTSHHASRLLLTKPDNPRTKDTALPEKIVAACPEMTALASLVHGFAALLTPTAGQSRSFDTPARSRPRSSRRTNGTRHSALAGRVVSAPAGHHPQHARIAHVTPGCTGFSR
ncbi:hypothetical protein JOF41_000973 [Saccharothrix coeruleofusca]|nr:hypothetical protein [Saccharothrix coeruleofusca]